VAAVSYRSQAHSPLAVAKERVVVAEKTVLEQSPKIPEAVQAVPLVLVRELREPAQAGEQEAKEPEPWAWKVRSPGRSVRDPPDCLFLSGEPERVPE
jgi:hypothetical protein